MQLRTRFGFVCLSGVLALSLLSGLSISSHADPAGERPHYAHALANLKVALRYLKPTEDANVSGNENHAADMVKQAINEITRAAADAKNSGETPTIDADLSHKDQLRRAETLLSAARKDLQDFAESNKTYLDSRRRGIEDLKEAIRAARKAIQDQAGDKAQDQSRHFEYLKLIGQMREARALMGLPSLKNIKTDLSHQRDELRDAIRTVIEVAEKQKVKVPDEPSWAGLHQTNHLQEALGLLLSVRKQIASPRTPSEETISSQVTPVLSSVIKQLRTAINDNAKDKH